MHKKKKKKLKNMAISFENLINVSGFWIYF